MRSVDIIRKKRLGGELDRDEIRFLVKGYTNGLIPDYQIAAFLMAVTLLGMSDAETQALTGEMLTSGSVLQLSDLPGEKIDKHSTGGVGDKTSLVVAPLAAAAGLVVPMISGRGLAHTGGTLDKLESIPGFEVGLDLRRFRDALARQGCALIGQTEEIAPADRKLYALRDVTATVDSIPLITASVLSKKLAEGISGLVLDVKVGSGAFMKSENTATELMTLLVSIAGRMGKRAVALLTDMNQPLGTHVGNALEVKEALDVLRGQGAHDLRELCLLITAHMLRLGKIVDSVQAGREKAARLIASGAGLQKLIEIVTFQKGDPATIDDPSKLPSAHEERAALSPRTGFVRSIDTEKVGLAAMLLGAGREKVDDVIDPAVGLVARARIGDAVKKGEELVTLHVNDGRRAEAAEQLLLDAYEIGELEPSPSHLIRSVLTTEEPR